MIDKKEILKLAKKVTDKTDLFVVDVEIDKGNKIFLVIDGDNGVTIGQIVEVSRFIEGSYDREVEDFELNVSSYGIDKPIILDRQYQKYKDKPIELLLTDESIIRGVLVSANAEKVVLKKEVVKKNRKSKKMLTGDEIEISLNIIKVAKGIIVF
mgnify:CR=1 FL=1